MTLRICILEADDLHPTLAEPFVGFGRMFIELFQVQDTAVEFSVFNVVQGDYPDTSQTFDAYLVTGSKADSFANDLWIVRLREYLAERFAQQDILLGICFGHQILALVLGGIAERSDKGWGIGMHSYTIEHKPQWLPCDVDEFQLLISHRDQVTALPEGAELLASSEFCPNAAFVVGQQVLCFQGHPEFTHEFSRGLLNLRESIYCPKEYQAACQSLVEEHDGHSVAQWMLGFVRSAKEARSNDLQQPLTPSKETLCSV